MIAGVSVNFNEILAPSGNRGVIWALEGSGDLNANLVRFDAGGGVGEHVNEEVDVLFVGVAGTGAVRVGGDDHPLSEGTIVFAPKGSRRATIAYSDGLAYLTVHRRRGPLRIRDNL
jgi:quercetin dioxygenase-like cupin family protein